MLVELLPEPEAIGLLALMVLHEHQELYRRYRDNGMRADFSWEKTGDDYLEVYRRAIEYAAFM